MIVAEEDDGEKRKTIQPRQRNGHLTSPTNPRKKFQAEYPSLQMMGHSSIELPCSPSLICIDRFDLVGSDDDEIPFWDILQAAIHPPLTNLKSLIDLLEILAVALRGTAGTDFELLRQTFEKYWVHPGPFFQSIWPTLRSLALELPSLFPGGLQVLNPSNDEIVLSRRHVACLVIHQFLCTLATPPWMTDGSPDFHIWYSSRTPHPGAVEAYLFALFRYFELLASTTESPLDSRGLNWPVTFTLRTVNSDYLTDELAMQSLTAFEVDLVPEQIIHKNEDELLGLPLGAAVISANKDVGFGRTAS